MLRFDPGNPVRVHRVLGGLGSVLLAGAITIAGCGDDPVGSEDRFSVRVTPEKTLAVGVGQATQFRAIVRDSGGSVVQGTAKWFVLNPEIASVDATGTVTSKAEGVVTVVALPPGSALTLDDLGPANGSGLPPEAGSAELEVYVPPAVESYQPGAVYRGRAGYTEYIPGRLPIVVAAPHGGLMSPSEIPDRTFGVTATDRETQDVLRRVAQAIEDRLGERPHTIISHLRRVKLDPNREIGEAAQDDPYAEQAWREYHGFVDQARATVETVAGRGLFVDVHGHGHDIQRIEWGYLLDSNELALDNASLAAPSVVARSSLKDLASVTSASFPELVRGPTSIGGLMAGRGIRGVPSPSEPNPGTNPYFRGGYSTRRHGSRDGGTVSGIQVELNWTGMRDEPENRQRFADDFADSLIEYLDTHLGTSWRSSWP